MSLMVGSRSAPIGTPSALRFSMLHQSARRDSVGGPGGPAWVLKHRHGHVDEARLALERLPAGGVDASLGRIGEELDLVVLVALALDPALALGDLGREPRHVEMVERDEPSVGVDAGAHGLGRADENPLLAGVHVVEEALLGGGALVVLHEGDL